MERTKNFFLLSIVSVLVLAIGITVAYFIVRIEGEGKTILVDIADLKVIFTDTNAEIEALDIEPGSSIPSKTFTVESQIDSVYYYNIIIKDLVNTFVTEGYLQYQIVGTNGGVSKDWTDVPKSATATDTALYNSIPLAVGATHSYTINFRYLNDENVDQSADMGKIFSGSIFITGRARDASKDLYNILKKAADNGTYAAQYTGSHQDSMDSSKSTENIYYWYGSNETNGTAILNMNNVVFADQCWQMIRTTDTGGVRLLYNGEPTTTIVDGETQYDCSSSRPGHIGGIRSTYNLSGTKYYASSYTTSVSGTTTTYTLTNPQSISVSSTDTTNTINNIVANYPYVCASGTSCTTLYKVDSQYSGTQAYVYASTYRDAIGISAFNRNRNSVGDVGYMYNSRYKADFTISAADVMLNSVTLNNSNLTTYGDYYFGETYTLSGGNHVLKMNNNDPAVKGNTITDYPSTWVGKYMCQSSSSSSCSTVYYISAIDTSGSNPIIYRAAIGYGKEYNNSSYKFLFGDSIVDNGDGTFEVKDNIQEVVQRDWSSEYSTKVGKYVCMPGYYTYDSVNNKYICSDGGSQKVGALRYITATTIANFTATSIYKYGFGIESYNGSYRLVGNNNEDGTLQYIYNWPNTSNSSCLTNHGDSFSNCGYKSLSKSHYSCYNLTGVCNQYYYIHHTSAQYTYSTQISGGKYVSTDLTDPNNILYLMLYQNDANGSVNTTNSTIKENVDSWYQNTLLTNYDSYIDDTIYCNNRSIKETSGVKQFGGWNPNGGTTDSNYSLQFNEYSVTSDLSCPNVTDKFSVSNSNARLTYKVGLMSSPEMNLLNQANARVSAYYYWLASPSDFSFGGAVGKTVYANNGNINTQGVDSTIGVRPAVSLISGMEYEKGDGSSTNPYIVQLNN